MLSLCALGCSSNDDPGTDPDPGEQTQNPPPGAGGTGGQIADPPTKDPLEAPPEKPPVDELARAQFEDLLLRTCGQCHGPDAQVVQGGIDYINNLDELISSGRIVPGSPETSLLYNKIKDGEMPPPGITPRVTDNELEALARFIDKLKTPPPSVCKDQFISYDDVYVQMQSDILHQKAEDREFIRYIGVTNRYNAGVCTQDLETERHSLSKLVNSLSIENSIRTPVGIDENDLIFRIDIRDYGWNRPIQIGDVTFDDGWEAIVASSPYAVEFEGSEADTIKLESGTLIPYLFSDAFAEQGPVGDLYYALVNVPATKDELLAQLDVDIQDDFDRRIVVRAGFTNSAISQQDRVVERHPQGIGGNSVFWDSFDFAADDVNDSIFVDPFDFNEGGSESLFSLPNGLHAYVIFDADGQRQAETNLIFDTRQEDFVVRNAVSCMTCHAQGLNSFVDEVLPFALANPLDFDAEEFELLQDVYPSPDDMKDILDDDRRIYSTAIGRAGVPTASRTDPISDSFLRFQRDVKVEVAAGDVHFPVEQFKRENNRFDADLAGLDSGFTVDRDDWSGLYLDTLCRVSVARENHPLQADCDAAAAAAAQ
jgi:mono/diheme cytochrome c family protein